MGSPQKSRKKAYRAAVRTARAAIQAFEFEVVKARSAADVARFRARATIDQMAAELLPKAYELATQGRPRLLALLHKIVGKAPQK